MAIAIQILDNDYWENINRAQNGKWPIAYTGTNSNYFNLDKVDKGYVGDPTEQVTFFTDNLNQAGAYARISAKVYGGLPVILRVDLEELVNRGLTVSTRENEFVVRGEIPWELLEVCYLN